MPDLPTFSDAQDAAEDVARHGRTLIPWLDSPPTCDECGALRYASETYHPRQAAVVASWECRECDAADTVRDPEYGGEFREGPSEGSDVVREWLQGRE